jgi:hypothetical protein
VTFSELRGELLELFSRGVAESFADESFNDLALRIMRFQARANPGYAGFLERRAVDLERIERWEEFPFLPTRAFKSAPLLTDGAPSERLFRTSGTTLGVASRGEHHVRDLSLYRASLLPNFAAHLLPEGTGLPLLCLTPSPEEVPDSSLSFMMEEVGNSLCGGDVRFFATPAGELRSEVFEQALAWAVADGAPVLVAGTAFAFLQWIDHSKREGWKCRLPPGSRLMDTGGYKGRSRSVSRSDLYAGLERSLGIPADRMVNEYGMTELLSQFYEPVLGKSAASIPDPAGRHHRGPPWVRTLVLDPLSLEPVSRGEVGILAHMDLANVGSVAAVLTEDLGRAVAGGFQLLGRSPEAEPRGCSLAMEDFLAALGEGS